MKFSVSGMSCAACQSHVEKAVNSLEGVSSCSVSLLTNSMDVEGVAKPDDIINAVRKAGYDAAQEGSSSESTIAKSLEDNESPKIRKRLISSLILMCILMYVAMGHVMFSWPLPNALSSNPLNIALLELLITTLVLVINQHFFISGFKALISKAPNMDTLVSLGSAASYIYSIALIFQMNQSAQSGEEMHLMHLLHGLYFESAAMILTLITVGKLLEARSKGKTTDAIKALLALSPKTAIVERDGKEVEVDAASLLVGDVFILKPGAMIAADGVVIEGSSAVDESSLTGESIPVDKEVGSTVSAGTLNTSGYMKCKATEVGDKTSLSRIIKLVTDAASSKAPIAKAADKVSAVFVPSVIAIAIVTFVSWLIAGREFSYALSRAISVLVISCPCALGLATPVAIMVSSGIGAKNGILFKSAASLEECGRVSVAALDKTGTITKGEPAVVGIYPLSVTEDELLSKASSIEAKSEHPLSRAIINEANKRGIRYKEANDFEALLGSGVSATVDGKKLIGGNIKLIGDIPESFRTLSSALSEEGKTPLFFKEDGVFIGLIAVADQIRPDSKKAVDELKGLGIKVVMLTGDNEKTAKAIGREAGVDEVVAGLKPEDKAAAIVRLKKDGKVMMVGDGINDALSLTSADIGLSIGSGTDVAIESAVIILMKNTLLDVSAAIRLSRSTLRNIHENLFWAFFYNALGIPLAAGLFIPLFGWTLNPMIAALMMSFSSVSVVSNALRLNFIRIYDSSRDKKRTNKNKENRKTMEKTMYIKGMMCSHCEASVNKALMAIDGVESATVSHESGTAIVRLNKNVSDDVLKAAVEAKDYTVTDIK